MLQISPKYSIKPNHIESVKQIGINDPQNRVICSKQNYSLAKGIPCFVSASTN